MSAKGGKADQPLLIPFGFDPEDEAAYRHVLAQPRASVAEVAAAIGWSRDKARAALARLQQAGLVTRAGDAGRGYVALAPDVVIDSLIAKRSDEMQQARVTAQRLAATLTQDAGSVAELVTVVEGRDAMQLHCGQLQESATEELLGFERPPYTTESYDDSLNNSALARGVKARFIYQPDALSFGSHLELIRAAIAAGEKARVYPSLPMWMLIADRERALVPLSPAEHRAGGALLIHSSWLLNALISLFEALWERAIPLPRDGTSWEPVDGRPPELPERDQKILTLLAAGLSEPAIARKLGVDDSTVRRRVVKIGDTLGATTRLQIGVQAARRGLL